MFRMLAVLFTFYSICVRLGNVWAENIRSHSELQSLLDMEAILLNQFESYFIKVEKEHEHIRRFLLYVDAQHDDMEEPEEYFGNPLNAFTTLSRFVNNWKHEVLDLVMANESFLEYKQNLSDKLAKHDLEEPTSDDLLGATGDLLEMQENDKQATSELANEVILADEETGENVTLSASDCYVIGRNLYQLQHYDYATEWLLQARQHAFHDAATFPSVSQVNILEHLTLSLLELGSYKLANKLNNEILKSEPTHETALMNNIILESKLVHERIKISNLKVDL